MNALVSLDSILEPAQALTATTLFGSGQVEAILAAIERDVRAEAFDITTQEGRDRIKSVAFKVARSKTTLDEIGKEHVAGIKAQAATIDAERRAIRDRLDRLKDEVRGPLTAWETDEAERIEKHERALVWLVESDRFATTPTAAMIRAQIADVGLLCILNWEEFKDRADVAISDARTKLEAMLAAAEQAERDAAELAELRQLKAERDARDAAEAIAKEEAARAERQLAEAAERDARFAERERQRAEQIEREKEAAAARAIEQERQRVAAEKAAHEAAERKRTENARHRAKVHREIIAALCSRGFAEIEANNVVSWLSGGEIPHVSITY